ncbi:MAG TPA: hypothetical protein VH702_12145, partial [Vicinamibacterales bacterium]
MKVRLLLWSPRSGSISTPLGDLGVLGATTTRSRQRGGTDSTSFNEAGLPGVARPYVWRCH